MSALDWLWIALGLLWMVSGAWVLRLCLRAPYLPEQPTLDEHAATACKVARPELRIDTATGSHDRLPISDHNRQMLADYVVGMWHHTQEMP